MALRVQGVGSTERVTKAVDDASGAVGQRLAALCADGLATERTGRVCGFALTPRGCDLLESLLVTEGLRAHDGLIGCYERFLGLNGRVLKASTDWQLRRDGGVEVANDHGDPAYDGSVIDRLVEIDERAQVCLEKMSSYATRFAPYGVRLRSCVSRLDNGDRNAFTAPLDESYHTVWFELHQDLLLTLGLERES